MRIAVLLSGGVDSSLALAQTVERYGAAQVTAFYLKIWLEDELEYLGDCPWEEDLAFARETCAALGVPLEVISLQREYHERVVSYVVDELKKGRTPSPDIFCNKYVKFGAFIDVAGKNFDRIVSGHYAILERDDAGKFSSLRKSVDLVKDQTYFLSQMSTEQLEKCEFPVGHLQKSNVRSEAMRLGLPARERKDSQGICFLGKIKYDDFVAHHLGKKTGNIVDITTGKILGLHDGFWFFTYGQRKGLRLHGGPWFVADKNVETNEIFVAHESKLENRTRDSFRVVDLHEISPLPQGKLTVKLRHGAKVYPCSLASDLTVKLDGLDAGIAVGQFAVFYDGTKCLGSAKIV